MRRPSPLAALWALLAVGCPKPATTPSTSPDTAETPSPAPETSVVECPAPEPFASLRWVPPRAEAATVIALDDPGLPEALALLQQGVRSPERQLPIRVAFALGQWTWQVPLLRTTLERAGFSPAQLVHVALPDGTSAWAWPPSCDLETLRANLERGWSLTLRTTPYGATAAASRTPEGDLAFPYDFVAYGASAYLLVPAGKASAITQQLAERSPEPGASNLGEQAVGLQPAPLRAAIRNTALLTPGAPASNTTSLHRIDARAWTNPPS